MGNPVVTVRKHMKSYINGQLASISSVKPDFRYSAVYRKFYMNSEAGLLIYKVRDQNDLTQFRNKWVNKFRDVSTSGDRKDLFRFYKRIRKDVPRIRYKANIRTRLRLSCVL
jgi:hypothetical protein